jgi:hypothetical protein
MVAMVKMKYAVVVAICRYVHTSTWLQLSQGSRDICLRVARVARYVRPTGRRTEVGFQSSDSNIHTTVTHDQTLGIPYAVVVSLTDSS